MAKKSPHRSTTGYLSPLAADIEAEFGSLRHVKGEGGPLPAAKLAALQIAFEQAADNLPLALRQGFHRNCTERLKSHFGCDYRDISESQFQEAIGVIGQLIIEARGRVDKLAIELPRAENRRWRVTFFDLNR